MTKQASDHRRARAQAVTCVALLACVGACTTAEPKRPIVPLAIAQPAPLDVQVRELAVASRPGERHRELRALTGQYQTTLVSVEPDGRETELASGEATIGWILDGHYLRWDASLTVAGQVYATTGFLGFDVRSGEYQQSMISDLSTGMAIARGRGDLERAGILWTLDQLDPQSGAQLRMTSLLRMLDADHFVLDQTAGAVDGAERVVRRTHYRRVRAPAQ